MSIHPSLRGSLKHKKQRSVLKRIERIKFLMEKGLWEENKSIFGLPKIKTVRIKFKKEKAVKEAPTAEAAAGTTPAETSAPAAKSPAEKKSEKK